MEKTQVPAARSGSVEQMLHTPLAGNKLLLLDNDNFGHRSIGVVYRPEREKGNYVPTLLAQRYDASVHGKDKRP